MELKISTIAKALHENELAQAQIKEMLKPLEEDYESLREQMLAALKKNHLASFRAEDTGATFTRAYRGSLELVEGKEEFALQWAEENKCMRLDLVKANKMLSGAGALPDGFAQRTTEYLATKREKIEN